MVWKVFDDLKKSLTTPKVSIQSSNIMHGETISHAFLMFLGCLTEFIVTIKGEDVTKTAHIFLTWTCNFTYFFVENALCTLFCGKNDLSTLYCR